MFIDAAAIKNIKPEYNLDNTMFSFVKAFNNDEVYLQMAYNAYYTNVELALANTWFNGICVYKTLFSDINIDDKLTQDQIIEQVKAQDVLGKELKIIVESSTYQNNKN